MGKGPMKSSPTRRKVLKRSSALASIGTLGSILATSESVKASVQDNYEGFSPYDQERSSDIETDDGEVIGELKSAIVGPDSVGSDREVQMSPALTYDFEDPDPTSDKAWTVTHPKIEFNTTSEGPGDVYITDEEALTPGSDWTGVRTVVEAVMSYLGIDNDLLHDPEADLTLDTQKENLECDYSLLGGRSFGAWWVTNFGGSDSGYYNFSMKAQVTLGYHENDRYSNAEYHKVDTIENTHYFYIYV